MTSRQREQLIVLLLIGLLALNYPLLVLFSKITLWFGIPLLYMYLFIVWIVFIVLAAAVIEKGKQLEPDTKIPGSEETG